MVKGNVSTCEFKVLKSYIPVEPHFPYFQHLAQKYYFFPAHRLRYYYIVVLSARGLGVRRCASLTQGSGLSTDSLLNQSVPHCPWAEFVLCIPCTLATLPLLPWAPAPQNSGSFTIQLSCCELFCLSSAVLIPSFSEPRQGLSSAPSCYLYDADVTSVTPIPWEGRTGRPILASACHPCGNELDLYWHE